MVEDGSSGHRVVQDSAQHFRVIALDFLDLSGNAPREIDSQFDGTRIPHKLGPAPLQKFEIFGRKTTPVGDGGSPAHSCFSSGRKIETGESAVKLFRNGSRSKSLQRKLRFCNNLRDCERTDFGVFANRNRAFENEALRSSITRANAFPVRWKRNRCDESKILELCFRKVEAKWASGRWGDGQWAWAVGSGQWAVDRGQWAVR